MWGVEDLARALPKLIDLHFERRALLAADEAGFSGAAVGCVVEHIVGLHRCLAPLLVPAQQLAFLEHVQRLSP